jgi:hypothetical protein
MCFTSISNQCARLTPFLQEITYRTAEVNQIELMRGWPSITKIRLPLTEAEVWKYMLDKRQNLQH